MRPSFVSGFQPVQAEISELSEAILHLLRREGAERTMILGARLGALVREEHGDLLRAEMERQGVRFVQLVEQIAGVRVVRDADTGLDVLIGLEGSLPAPALRGVACAAARCLCGVHEVRRCFLV